MIVISSEEFFFFFFLPQMSYDIYWERGSNEHSFFFLFFNLISVVMWVWATLYPFIFFRKHIREFIASWSIWRLFLFISFLQYCDFMRDYKHFIFDVYLDKKKKRRKRKLILERWRLLPAKWVEKRLWIARLLFFFLEIYLKVFSKFGKLI